MQRKGVSREAKSLPVRTVGRGLGFASHHFSPTRAQADRTSTKICACSRTDAASADARRLPGFGAPACEDDQRWPRLLRMLAGPNDWLRPLRDSALPQ